MKINLKDWMAPQQFAIFTRLKRGEEGAFFSEVEQKFQSILSTMPKTYDQDGKEDEAIAYLHYFGGACDYYITELDRGCDGDSPEQFQSQMFGLKKEGSSDYRYGYIDLRFLKRMNMELYFHFEPKTIAKIKK